MKPISTSVYTFSHLIEGGFIYVDKTAQIYRLIEPAFCQYFLSRPRRFGKSLLISTLKAIFLGQRELFKGLALDELDFAWKSYPVIHLDLGSCQAASGVELEENLLESVMRCARANGESVSAPRSYQAFMQLCEKLSAKGKLVILVDEYDKPLLGALGNVALARELLPILKAFYAVIKSTEALQRFALLTGVSKFSKVSVFSDLNNLTDLTMDPRSATLLGYTQEELEANFDDRIDALAAKSDMDRNAILREIRSWYNGYRFAEDAATTYNPVSVMRLFDTGRFSNYWFETGTPTFLIELLKARRLDITDLAGKSVPETAFSTYEIDKLEPLPLLQQTGYLTIAKSAGSSMGMRYTLDYPNREVRSAFETYLAAAYANLDRGQVGSALFEMVDALTAGEVPTFMDRLRIFFANIPYDIQLGDEKYYQSLFHVILSMVGLATEAEVRTESGRIDAVVKTQERIFIFEFKLHGTAAEALAQIKSKRYFDKYRADGRTLILIGTAFDAQSRNLGPFLAETLPAASHPLP